MDRHRVREGEAFTALELASELEGCPAAVQHRNGADLDKLRNEVRKAKGFQPHEIFVFHKSGRTVVLALDAR